MISGSCFQEGLNEVIRVLHSYPNLKPGNHYNSPTPTLGLSVPQSRAALKNGYGFLHGTRENILSTWDYIWNHGKYFEEMSQAIYFYEKKSLNQTEFVTIANWINRCDNWAHSDGLSSIYSLALEENQQLVWPVLQKWNQNKNPWKRRQSVVSLLYYARARRKRLPFDDLMKMVIPLLHDSEYYVQKGIGWTIREIFNCYPEQTMRFIEANVKKISPAAWQATTEKLGKDFKSRLLTLRKNLD